MPTPTQVQLSFIYAYVRQILDFGRENEWQTDQGTLKLGRICKNIIVWTLKLRKDTVIDRILKAEGGTLETLVDRMKVEYATRKGYMRKEDR